MVYFNYCVVYMIVTMVTVWALNNHAFYNLFTQFLKRIISLGIGNHETARSQASAVVTNSFYNNTRNIAELMRTSYTRIDPVNVLDPARSTATYNTNSHRPDNT